MKDTRCKVCSRDVTGQPSVFRKGWWYCYEHAAAVSGIDRAERPWNAADSVIDHLNRLARRYEAGHVSHPEIPADADPGAAYNAGVSAGLRTALSHLAAVSGNDDNQPQEDSDA